MTSPAAPPLAHRHKRTKPSRETSPALSGSNRPKAAVKAPSAPAESTDATGLHSGDESSDLSESSEEPSDLSSSEDDDEENAQMADAHKTPKEPEVVNLRANRGQKPTYKLDDADLGPDIRDFLKDFLPKLKAANEELEADRKQGTLKKREIDVVDGEENEQYIEMNLGLGVLKMKDGDNSSESSSSSDSEMGDDDDDNTKEKDVLGKLMGQEKIKEPAGIQELGEKQGS